MYIQPGLFSGRAGILPTSPVGRPTRRRIRKSCTHVRRLAWHAMPHGGGIAFPGTQLLRLSMDLATGTAGVLLALGAVLHDEPVGVPLLALPRRRRPGPEFPRQASWANVNHT